MALSPTHPSAEVRPAAPLPPSADLSAVTPSRPRRTTAEVRIDGLRTPAGWAVSVMGGLTDHRKRLSGAKGPVKEAEVWS